MSPQMGIFILWDAWAVSWFIAALWSDRAAKRPPSLTQIPHWIMTLIGGVLLLGIRTRYHQGPGRLWDVSETWGWGFVALAGIGFGFCWWARLQLGRLWSGTVTRKADHRVVDTGPYALVRHPIYTGIILAAFATGLLRGVIFTLAGAAAMTLGLWMKAQNEERFLREELGPEAYDAYSRRVPMLVPRFLRKS